MSLFAYLAILMLIVSGSVVNGYGFGSILLLWAALHAVDEIVKAIKDLASSIEDAVEDLTVTIKEK